MIYCPAMGTCLGCCPMKNPQRKQQQRKMYFRTKRHPELLCNDQEMLELEQRVDGAAKKQGNKVSTVAYSDDFTKPTRLMLKKNHMCWLGKDNNIIAGTLGNINDLRSPTDATVPLLLRENSLADSSSLTGSQRWEQINFCGTPGSSVDLEWENEIGLTPPPNFIPPEEELTWMAITETTNTSWRSSPVSNSNGLEWDGDFTSVEVSGIAEEAQQLIADIEQITARTLKETDPDR